MLAASLAFGLLAISAGAAESYVEWLNRHQVPQARRGVNDDPAGDQVPNVLKYAMGFNPMASATATMPQAEPATVQGVERLVLTVPKNADAMGTRLTVESSADLATWSSTGLIVLSDTATSLRVADSVPVNQAQRRFMRVRASLDDPLSGVVNWEQVAAIRQILDRSISSYEIPGIVYSIKAPGREPWMDARGVRDSTSREALGTSDRFRIGSASKTFVGMAALQLIQQRKLRFEQPISAYLPANVLSNYAKDKITIRMLLQHTSGINNYTEIEEDWFIPYIMNRTRVWTNEELVQLINARYSNPPSAAGKFADPGVVWYYSNTNTVLLAMIVEKITGKTIREVITENFINRLGLRETVYPAPGQSTMPAPFTRGYMDWANFIGLDELPGYSDVTVYDPSGVGPAGPMISSVRDLSVWVEALVRDEALLPDFRAGHIDWKYYIDFNGSTSGPRPGGYGMNIAHEPDYQNNADYYIIGHRGQISGYDTAMMYLPEKNVSVVMVCNRSLKFAQGFPTNALEAGMNAMIKVLYPDLIANNQMPPATGTVPPVSVTLPPRAASSPQETTAERGWRHLRAPLVEYR